MSSVRPKETYGITELARTGVFWWIKDHRAYRNTILTDRNWENILEADMKGEGKGKRYEIKGRNISRFIKRYGPGLELMARINTTHDTRNSEKRGRKGGKK